MTDQPPLRNRRQSDLRDLRQRVAEREQLNSAQEGLGKQLKHSLSLLRATIESTADGLLVVDNQGNVVSYNQQFLKLWNIPTAIAEQRSDRKLIDTVLDQLLYPEEFLKKIRHLYDNSEEESFDTLEFKDGRVFERYSQPQRIGKDIVGRVWSFHDVTAYSLTKKALEQSTAEFEAILNAIPDAAIFVDLHRRAIRINPAFTRLFGYGIDELRGRTTEVLFAHEADFRETGIKRFHRDALQEQPAAKITYRRKDGTLFLAETIGSSVRDSAGRVIGFFCLHRDITERTLAEKELLAEKRISDVTINMLPGIFCLVDGQGRFLRWNKNFEEITQYQPEEIAHMHPRDFFHGEDQKLIAEKMQEALASGGASDEAGLVSRDGRTTPYFFTGVRIALDDGPGIIGMGIDISERKRVEEQLLRTHAELEERVRERTASLVMTNEKLEAETAEKTRTAEALVQVRQLLENVIDTMPVGVAIIDPEGTVHHGNPAMKEIWGGFKYVSIDEYGEYKGWRLTTGERIAPEEWAAFRAVKEGKSSINEEVEIECFDGSRKIVLCSAVPVRGQQQQILGAVVVMEDITAMKEGEKKISISNALMKLFSERYSRKEYLDSLVEFLSTLSRCEGTGVRSWNMRGETTGESYRGFDREFWEREKCFSPGHETCNCVGAAMKQPDNAGAAHITRNGAFWCGDLLTFFSSLSAEDKKGCHFYCLDFGFASLGIIPIRHRQNVLGVVYFADKQKNNLPDDILGLIESLTPLIGEALYRFSMEEEARSSQEQLRSLTAYLQEVREKERTTIAREIHDELGQILTALKMNLSWVGSQYGDHGQLSEKTKSMITLVDATIQKVKRITTELRPDILDHLGITAAIEWQSAEFSKLTGIPCTVTMESGEIVLPSKQTTQIFRIFEEILTNIIRHAGATQVHVRFHRKDQSVILAVQDNGKGITTAELQSPGSFGIMGIRERVHALGGWLRITGSPDAGTRVTVEIPQGENKDADEEPDT